ncbi:MAG: DegT/DnrJ/EryC1/StrS family aminotransferase [Verrucomicrobia bacterium]|nr:DegT/DnrJ/EryC1/StrS family aminotransferase [Verrucomicrobiota bacterium]
MTKVPFFDLKKQFLPLREEILNEVAAVCDEQAFILGAKVEKLEEAIVSLCGEGYAVGVSSGTDAELLILMALGIGPGDAVVTTPFTFFSTAGCIARLGAKPAFVDIDPETFCLSPKKLELFFSTECTFEENVLRTREGFRVKAVIPIHLFGLCCHMDEIQAVCAPYALPVIEDAAQAIGADYPSSVGIKHAGGIGEFGYFSFYPTKNLGAFGDAGMAIAKDSRLGDRMKALRNHGMKPKYCHEFVGGNFRLDALQAAILLKKLPYLAGWSKRRWTIAQHYRERFANLAPEIRLPDEPYVEQLGHRGHIYHQFVVRSTKRDELRDYLRESGIGTEIFYPVSLNRQKCFAYLHGGPFPESEAAARQVLAFPVFPELTDNEVELVADTVTAFLKK